jgi:bifunctional DNA-binding transcriptional regulator/antitoxin component of YhaV-PrlF toxin-antitoxin module
MDFITRTQIGEQGQVTLPDSFIRANHLEPGDLLVLTQVGDHLIVMPKKNKAVRGTQGERHSASASWRLL